MTHVEMTHDRCRGSRTCSWQPFPLLAPGNPKEARSVPVVGLLAGLKLAGLSLATYPAKSPAKTCPAVLTAQTQTPLPPCSLERSLPGHLTVETFYSDVIEEIAIMILQKSPKRAGRNSGVRVWTSAGQLFFCGALRGSFCRAKPRKLQFRKMPAKETS